jgi:hypothetical protein
VEGFKMKKYMHLVLVLLILSMGKSGIAQHNQNKLAVHLSEALKQGYTENYIKGYAQPLVTSFGTLMGGALYHRAYTKGFPRFDAGISAVYISIPDEELKFIFNNENVPTFFGSNKQSATGILGSGLEGFWLPQLHANIGLFANLEVMVRGFKYNIDEIGDVTMLGFGVKYGLSDLIPIPMFPIDMSVQGAYQTLGVGNWLSVGTFVMNLNVSKGLIILPVDIYAGVGFETTSMTIKTNDIPQVEQFGVGDISFDGDNNLRLNFGLSWTLLILNIHADYNIGEYNSIGGGVMIVL